MAGKKPMPSLHERPWVKLGAYVVDPCTAVAGMCGADGCDESNDAIGTACSQSTLWGAATARMQARSRSAMACWSRMARMRARWKPDPNSSADVPPQPTASSRNIIMNAAAPVYVILLYTYLCILMYALMCCLYSSIDSY